MSDLKEKILGKMREPTLSGLATITADGKPWVRYIMAMADENLNIWFCTNLNSRKVEQIRRNPEVHLHTGVSSLETAESYLQVEGRAEILTDKQAKEAMWSDMLKPYFSGPDDPSFCVGRIKPSRIEFWAMEPGGKPEVWAG